MVESDSEYFSGAFGGVHQLPKVRGVAPGGFFDQDMLPGLERRNGAGGQKVVRSTDNDDVEIVSLDEGFPVGGNLGSGGACQGRRAFLQTVGHGHKPGPREILNPLFPDQSRANQSDGKHQSLTRILDPS